MNKIRCICWFNNTQRNGQFWSKSKSISWWIKNQTILRLQHIRESGLQQSACKQNKIVKTILVLLVSAITVNSDWKRWLYAGWHQTDGLQMDTHCPFSGTWALPEWLTRTLSIEHTCNRSNKNTRSCQCNGDCAPGLRCRLRSRKEEREVGRESWVMEASDATRQRLNIYQGSTSGSVPGTVLVLANDEQSLRDLPMALMSSAYRKQEHVQKSHLNWMNP